MVDMIKANDAQPSQMVGKRETGYLTALSAQRFLVTSEK